MDFKVLRFNEIDLADAFFDSLKADYKEFPAWFQKKANETAYVSKADDGTVNGFLYLKIEDGAALDVSPPFPAARRLKVGTLKIDPHGTRLGERFIKKIFDHALHEKVDEIYVTVFPQHTALIKLFERYGFSSAATKQTSNGIEHVLRRALPGSARSLLGSYPFVHQREHSVYLLALYPQWHTRLLPDSILKNENADIVQDVSHTNSIHKVYLAAMRGMDQLKPGDVLVIYRTNDNQAPAHYRSVATSVCVVEEFKSINSFSSRDDFLSYCRPYSVFTEEELRSFWSSKKYPHVIRFTYNFALKKRVTRKALLEDVGLSAEAYFGFLKLADTQFLSILKLGEINENLVIN